MIIGWMQDPYHLENLGEKKFNFRFEYLLDDISVVKVPDPDETIVQQAIDYPFLQRPAPPRIPDPEVVLSARTVHFDFASHTLSLSEQQVLDSLAAQILKIPEGVFEIIGHTDDIGSNNKVLSLQRAETVKSYLVKKTGFPDYLFRISGKGSLKAVSDNQTEKGRALNRRVEVKQSELTLSMVLYEKASLAALNGQPDTAFYYLRRWQARPDVDQILLLYDPDLVSLHAHKAWEAVAYFVEQSYDKYNKDKEFAWQLANLYCKDQYYRGLETDFELAKGYIPDELDMGYYDFMKKMEEEEKKPNNHIEIMSDLIQKYGWPDPNILGKRLSEAPVYVILHSGNLALQKHWLPAVEQAFRDGKIEANWFAHVFDAVMREEKGVQRYGTAYFANPEDRLEYSIGPLEDEANVDSLRAEIGMPPLTLKEFRVVEKPDEDN
ncbi:MAG: OmpA family protein [Saprospiraceae bacterium]